MRILVFCSLFLLSASVTSAQSFSSRIGVVNSMRPSGGCMAIKNRKLGNGAKIQVVVPGLTNSVDVAIGPFAFGL